MSLENEISKCINNIYFIKTSTMSKPIGYGHRYLGFSFPGHKANLIKKSAYLEISEKPHDWEFILIRCLADGEEYALDASTFTLDQLKLSEVSAAVYGYLQAEQVSHDGLYAWVARPMLNKDKKLEIASDKIVDWFVTDWFDSKTGELKSSFFNVTETRAPAINRMVA